MNFVATNENFYEDIEPFLAASYFSVDTETTGLLPYKGHRLFSIIISNGTTTKYFNFRDFKDHLGKKDPVILNPQFLDELNQRVFSNENAVWFMHNAKFDLHMLKNAGIDVLGRVYDTKLIAKLIDPRHTSYSLDACLNRMDKNLHKSDLAKEYLDKHNLDKKYYLIPFDVISKYGFYDALYTYKLGQFQRKLFNDHIKPKHKGFSSVFLNETEVTKVLFHVEHFGIKINQKYTLDLMAKEQIRKNKLMAEYKAKTGADFIDSAQRFKEYFSAVEGIQAPLTEKGNPSFSKENIQKIGHPLAKTILEIRGITKRITSYYENFIKYADKNDIIHTDFEQLGAITGRMSAVRPALQTIPKRSEDVTGDANIVRRCFVPYSSDYVLFMPDYDQMEFRMMLDQAGELALIKSIQEGLDVHTATAEQTGIDRDKAKTLNFLLLYGGGAKLLGEKLGLSEAQAKRLRSTYFHKMPRVYSWIKRVSFEASVKGYTRNWAGRVVPLARTESYKAPNYIIQGGCADVVKRAKIQCFKLLQHTKSKMCLQVHDELIFNMHKEDLALCAVLADTMSNVYPCKHLKLSASPSYSWKSWGDKLDGYPSLPY